MLQDQANPGPVDLSDDADEELSIDLLNDSFVLDGVARIMAGARARGVGPGAKEGAGSCPAGRSP